MSDYIQTATGRKFYPLDPKPQDVSIEDIAHSLAQKARYTGHAQKFISVAEHSVNVANYLPPELKLIGLLHDAAEAYLPDVARPIKGDLYFKVKLSNGVEDFREFREVEEDLLAVIFKGLGIPYRGIPDDVKMVDTLALRAESHYVIPGADDWDLARQVPMVEELFPRPPVTWQLAKNSFLWKYEELTGKRTSAPRESLGGQRV